MVLEGILTTQVLEKVAIAVFSQVAKAAVPTDKIKKVVRKDPEMLAFQAALAGTYATFAKSHHDFTESFFDEHFLAHGAAPILSRCLSRHDLPAAQDLVDAWAKQFPAGINETRRRTAVPVAADFLRLFTAELKNRPELRDRFDSQAAERTAAATEATAEQVAALQESIAGRLDSAVDNLRLIRETFDGAGLDALGQYLGRVSSATPRLREYYLDPSSVFRRLQLDSFTGREWLRADLDAFLTEESRPSGAWLLIAEAGFGKSAFLADLVQQRNYVHVFLQRSWGSVGTTRAIQSLAVQLITRYEIQPYSSQDSLPANVAGLPDFLTRMLEDAAARLAPGERLPIVIDALDEADSVGGNVLGLPTHLPDGVFLVLSARPKRFRLHLEPEPHRPNLRPADNDSDVRDYLVRASHEPWLRERLDAAQVPDEQFVGAVESRSRGNWMYLHYVMRDLKSNRRLDLLDLDRLPVGLAGYYADHWLDWREREDWSDVCLPILATLGAAAEPLTIERTIAWSGVSAPAMAVRRLLREDWSAFIQQVPGTPPGFQPYHATFRDFLEGELQTKHPTDAVRWLMDELAEASADAHRRIVGAVADSCDGRFSDLPDGYGRRHLSFHLGQAGERAMLQSLVRDKEWFNSQERVAPDGSYYLADLAEAWHSSRSWTAAKQRPTPEELQDDTWCALAMASIRHRSSQFPQMLVRQLVEAAIWTPEQALTAVRLISDPSIRAQQLLDLVEVLSGDIRELATTDLVEALVKASNSEEIDWQHRFDFGYLWRQTVLLMTPAICESAFASLRRLTDEPRVVEALSPLLAKAGSSLTRPSLALAQGFMFEWNKAAVVQAVAALDDASASSSLLALVRSLSEDQALSSAVIALADMSAFEDIDELASECRRISDDESRAEAVAALLPRLSPEALERLRHACLEDDPSPGGVRILARLADRQPSALDDAIRIARRLPPGTARARGLVAVALRIPELVPDALAEVEGIDDDEQVSQLLLRLAPALDRLPHQEVALQIGLQLDGWTRSRVLKALSDRLPDQLRERAMQLLKREVLADPASQAWEDLAAVAPLTASRAVLELIKAAPPHRRLGALQILVERIPDDLIPKVIPALSGALYVTASHNDPIRTLGARLAPPDAHSLLKMLRDEGKDHTDRDWTIARDLPALVPALESSDTPLAIDLASSIAQPVPKVRCLLELRNRLAGRAMDGQPDLLALARDAAQEADSRQGRAACLSMVAEHVHSADERRTLLLDALAAARTANDEADVLQPAFPLLSANPTSFASLLRTVGRRIGDFHRRKDWLVAGAAHIDGDDAVPIFKYMFQAAEQEHSASSAVQWLVPLLHARQETISERAFDALVSIARNAPTPLSARELLPLFDAATRLHRDPPLAEALQRLGSLVQGDFAAVLPHLLGRVPSDQLISLIDSCPYLMSRLEGWRALVSLGSSAERELALARVRLERTKAESPEHRGLVATLLLELDPSMPDRREVVASALQAAMEADEMQFLGDSSRPDLLQRLASLLSSSEMSWVLDHLDELQYADYMASALAAIAACLDGEDLERAIEFAGAIPYPRLKGEALCPLAARLCRLGDPQRALMLARTIDHLDWRVKAELEPLVALASDHPTDLVDYLRRIVRLAPKTYTSVGAESRSWLNNRGWQAAAGQQVLQALASVPSELEQALEVIYDGGLLLSCLDGVVALATGTTSWELTASVWGWTMDVPADRRADLAERVTLLRELATALCPTLQTVQLGDAILDVTRRWP